ncbi:MAG: Sensor histidine kinase LiaS [Pelotomaculum sp. PtaU1.Bin035]|nr:MAG: Sensor histidine kinase LiaS [Pelotomaculum sp. PtaU1.Bin035]
MKLRMGILLTYRTLKWFTILLVPLIIGGFEFMRHDYFLRYIPMETGNYYITILTFFLSYFYATWMFRVIEKTNRHLSEEQARRAVYEERERLARELHDNIAQTLFFLNVKLKKGQVEEARFAASDIDHQVRQAIFNLRDLPEEGVSLSQRLNKWIQEWSMLTGIETVPNINIPVAYFSSGEDVQLFGIIQEAFTNIRKHAGAKQVKIDLAALSDG